MCLPLLGYIGVSESLDKWMVAGEAMGNSRSLTRELRRLMDLMIGNSASVLPYDKIRNP